MAKPRLPQTPDELDGWAAKFFGTIQAESDRGCVLVAAAFLDEALELLLRSKMSKDKSIIKASVEPLFTGIGPLRSFWAKTELCRVLGFLPEYEYADLKLMRNLRNLFAHSYIDAKFTDPSVVKLVTELHHFGIKIFPLTDDEKGRADFVRQRFSLSAAWIAGRIHLRSGMVGPQ